jgi:hypothetical protein
MKKPKVWQVTHHYTDPRREEIETYSRRADAVRSVKEMENANFNDDQYSEIENLVTGVKGSRRWGKRSIQWSKIQADPISGPFPRAKASAGGVQLGFATAVTAEPTDQEPENFVKLQPERVSIELVNHDRAREEVNAAGVTK